MMEWVLGSGLVSGAVGVIYGYGTLNQRVAAVEKAMERLSDRIEDLTDFLLKEAHGENPSQINSKAD